jgi:hypothetical protein
MFYKQKRIFLACSRESSNTQLVAAEVFCLVGVCAPGSSPAEANLTALN